MSSLLTIKEAAEYLKLNYMTMYKLAQRGKVPASKVGGNWRFNKKTLDQWLNSQSRLSQKRVLVVDDDSRLRDMLEDVISDQGHKVEAVESGEEAIERVKKRQFDLIFLDLVLPGISGVEVLRSIKAKDKKVVVVIVTGYGDDPIALEAINLGPQLVMRKPFNISDVVQVLNMITRVKS